MTIYCCGDNNSTLQVRQLNAAEMMNQKKRWIEKARGIARAHFFSQFIQ